MRLLISGITASLALCALAFQRPQPVSHKESSSPETTNRQQVLMKTVLYSLKQYHYAPEKIDDAFSERVFELYLKRLDPNKNYFLAEDIKKLEAYKKQLDDEVETGQYAFFALADELFMKRFVLVKGFYEEFLARPFDIETDELIETASDKLDYAKSEAELKEVWRKNLKFQVISRVHTAWELQEKLEEKKEDAKKEEASEEAKEKKSIEELEKEMREKVLKSYDNWAKEIEKNEQEERFAAYVNTFANAHEPHSSYFPPLEKENFNIKMSGKLEGIGAQLIQEDGFVKVTRVVPGSASFRQGDLEAGDKIIKVGQGSEAPVNVIDIKLDDVLPLIRGKKGTEVRLTVRKKDGSIKLIPIIRDIVVLEDSYAKSAILEHGQLKDKKVGLIDLRSFYADFQDPRGRRCARDVKKELQKLLAEEIDGIVIDLRNNGGGSLSDVVDMTGLFINRGPVCLVKGRDNVPQVLEDRDPSLLYNGPLVILVSGYSASASEIMAAALQDYGRAIIVGTDSSTFGKGTVQRFFDLDPMVSPIYREGSSLGAIKVTIQKFYRINGGSTQLRGVEPDIVLPSPYRYMKSGEREAEHPMAWSEIPPSHFKKLGHTAKLDRIKKKSQKRVKANSTFQLIEGNAQWYKDLQEESKYSLSFSDYQTRKKTESERAETFKAISQEIEALKPRSLSADLVALASDTLRAESTKSWHKNIKKDPYLEEVLMILNDMN